MTPFEKLKEELLAEFRKKIANQHKDRGFLHNGTRAIDDMSVEMWLESRFDSLAQSVAEAGRVETNGEVLYDAAAQQSRDQLKSYGIEV